MTAFFADPTELRGPDVYVGIDPGLTGGIAVIGLGPLPAVTDMPTLEAGTKKRKILNVKELAEQLAFIQAKVNGRLLVAYEEPMACAWRKDGKGNRVQVKGVLGASVQYRHIGAIEGILAALGIAALPPVRPVTWKKKILNGIPKGGKEVSVHYVQAKYPGVELIPPRCRKPRDGRADAICLAEYAREVGR